jgi:hypothetical protein
MTSRFTSPSSVVTVQPPRSARVWPIDPKKRRASKNARISQAANREPKRPWPEHRFVAPLLFGVVSMHLGGKESDGLQLVFLLLLPVLAASSILLMIGARHSPEEVAAVEESEVVEND